MCSKKCLLKHFRNVAEDFRLKVPSVIKQKNESQNGCCKKTKHAKFSKKRTFLIPCKHTFVCVSRGKKCSFFGKFGVLFFSCNTLFKIHPFDILSTVFCIHCFFIAVFSVASGKFGSASNVLGLFNI